MNANTSYYTWAPHCHYSPLVWHRGGEVFPIAPQFGMAENLAREQAGGDDVNIKKVVIREPKNPQWFEADGRQYTEELLREPIRAAKESGVDLLRVRYAIDAQERDVKVAIVIDPSLRVTYTQVTPVYVTEWLVEKFIGSYQFQYWYGLKFYHRARWDEVAEALLRCPPREYPIAIWARVPHLNTGDTWEARLALCKTDLDRAWLGQSCPPLGGNDTWEARLALQRDARDSERLALDCPPLGGNDTAEAREALIKAAEQERRDNSRYGV